MYMYAMYTYIGASVIDMLHMLLFAHVCIDYVCIQSKIDTERRAGLDEKTGSQEEHAHVLLPDS